MDSGIRRNAFQFTKSAKDLRLINVLSRRPAHRLTFSCLPARNAHASGDMLYKEIASSLHSTSLVFSLGLVISEIRGSRQPGR